MSSFPLPQRRVVGGEGAEAFPCLAPQRSVCLTEEPTEVLYAIGESNRIAGISGFTVRPSRARKEKPKVSAFTSAKIGVGFSDIHADIARELTLAGVMRWIHYTRSSVHGCGVNRPRSRD